MWPGATRKKPYCVVKKYDIEMRSKYVGEMIDVQRLWLVRHAICLILFIQQRPESRWPDVPVGSLSTRFEFQEERPS